MSYILKTERLMLREFNLNDTPFIIQLLNSPGWIKFIGDRNVRTEEQAKNYLLNGPIKSYSENGFGLSLVELKEDKASIGMCGILKRKELEYSDIGFAFLPEYAGKGYAYEVVNATLVYARTVLKLTCISAITVPTNISSIKLLEKTGFKFVKLFSFPGDKEELMFFSSLPENMDSN